MSATEEVSEGFLEKNSCQECDAYFNTHEDFERHMSAYHIMLPGFCCYYCNFKSEDLYEFSEHLSKFHPDIMTPTENTNWGF